MKERTVERGADIIGKLLESLDFMPSDIQEIIGEDLYMEAIAYNHNVDYVGKCQACGDYSIALEKSNLGDDVCLDCKDTEKEDYE